MSITDMKTIEKQVSDLVDYFQSKMIELYREVPEAFADRSSEIEWGAQVRNCSSDLEESLNEVIESYESKLHNGDYFKELVEWQSAAGADKTRRLEELYEEYEVGLDG